MSDYEEAAGRKWRWVIPQLSREDSPGSKRIWYDHGSAILINATESVVDVLRVRDEESPHADESESPPDPRDDDLRYYAFLVSVFSWILLWPLLAIFPPQAALWLVIPVGWVSAFIARRSRRMPFKILGWASLLFWTAQLIMCIADSLP